MVEYTAAPCRYSRWLRLVVLAADPDMTLCFGWESQNESRLVAGTTLTWTCLRHGTPSSGLCCPYSRSTECFRYFAATRPAPAIIPAPSGDVARGCSCFLSSACFLPMLRHADCPARRRRTLNTCRGSSSAAEAKFPKRADAETLLWHLKVARHTAGPRREQAPLQGKLCAARTRGGSAFVRNR